MYSVGNPATVYGDIEVVLGENAVECWDGESYLVFDNLAIMRAGRHGFSWANTNASNIIFRNLTMKWMGGMEENGEAGYRLGNGIEVINATFTDFLVEKCIIEQVYDAAVTPQFPGTDDYVENFFVNGNIFINCRYAFEFSWDDAGNSYAESIHFNNNTCWQDTDMRFHGNERWGAPNAESSQVTFYDEGGAGSSDIQIKNNIFYGEAVTALTTAGVRYNFYPQPAWIDTDYNQYYSPDAYTGTHALGVSSGSLKYNLGDWQASTGNPDLNGYNSDPDFKNPTTNFRPGSGSDAVDGGVAIAEYTTDYEGVDVGTPPNIGALETTED